MSDPWLIPLEALAQRRAGADPRQVGGKAARLAWLLKNGFSVPRTWVLPERAFAQAELSPGCEPRALLRAAGGRAGDARAAEARQEILNAALPRGLAVELEDLWRNIEPEARWGLAIRSSATCEDGAVVSMAGLADTVLGVRGADAMANAVRQVWASIASGRALAYLAARGVRDVGMAVVIQVIVEAQAAGVMFTRAPSARTSTANERIINVGWGLGSPVVDGRATPDVLRMDERGRVLESVVAVKPLATVVGPHGLTEVATSKPKDLALNTSQAETLAEVAARLEKLERVAWDVEFACDAKKTWIVQARPVTGNGFPTGGDETTVWSSVNVGEALPGVATPLTWSVAGSFSETGFRRAFAALGCRVPKNAVLVGNVHGRFYLNLTQFMRIAAQVPTLDPRTLVELGGGSGGEELATQVADVSRKGFYARLPLTAMRLLKEQLRLVDEVARYEAFAEKAWRANTELDLAILPDEAIATTIRDIQELLERTGTVMLTCASSTLGTHLVLKMLLERVAPLGADRLAQSLTSGIRDLESARPAIAIMHIADIARREPLAREVLEQEATADVSALPEGPTRRALQSFLERYGDRVVREAELATPRWGEDPRPVFTMLRVALRAEAGGAQALLARARAQSAAEMLKLLPRLSFVEQTAVRHLVARAQKAARLREGMRAWVTRVLGMLRNAALEADKRLLRRNPDLERDLAATSNAPIFAMKSVFFLTVDELVSALRVPNKDLAPLVRARRAELARDLARTDPPTTFVGSPPPIVVPPSGGDVLRGLPASAGVVEGRARVLLGADEMGDLLPGEILVVHTTDIGWTPLFLQAAGVVTELGGPLSHAAVVAREFGVPSVVNVEGATRVIRSGDFLRVDGDRGSVERLRDRTS